VEQRCVGSHEPRLSALEGTDEVPRDVRRQISVQAEREALLPVLSEDPLTFCMGSYYLRIGSALGHGNERHICGCPSGPHGSSSDPLVDVPET
jgi:hypothetical protein